MNTLQNADFSMLLRRNRSPIDSQLSGLGAVLTKIEWGYVIIFVSALLTHGLLLFNDGIYWDGWIMHTYIAEGDWNSLYHHALEAGLPLAAYVRWVAGYFPNAVFGAKLMAFIFVVLSAILVYKIGKQSRLIGSLDSLWIALFSLSYPAFQVYIQFNVLHYLAAYFCFLLAILLALWSEQANRVKRLILRISSLVGFFVGFSLSNSLLMFYFAFLLFLFLCVRQLREISKQSLLTGFITRRLDFMLLPFLYWVVKRFSFPAHGSYAGYNQFLFSPRAIVVNLIGFFNNAIYGQLNHALAEIAKQPALWLFVILTALWFYSAFRVGSARFLGGRVNSYALLAFGFLLLVLGMLPYVIVGKAPSLHGWNTRHALLVALPMAVIIVAIARLAFTEPAGSLPRQGWVFLAILVLAFSFSTIKNYISWQARWVKDRSIMANLATLDTAHGISVFWVDDQFPAGGEGYYRFYEWSSMFKTVWGDESRIGLDQRIHSAEFLVNGQQWGFFNKTMNLSDFDPAGCQAILTIRRAPLLYSDAELSARYLFYKFFRGEDKLTEFLSGVTDIQVQPISSPQAVNCPTQ